MIDHGEMINHFRYLYIDRGGYPRKTGMALLDKDNVFENRKLYIRLDCN